MFWNDEPSPRICWLSETQAIIASRTELTPRVAMKESMRTFVTSSPLTTPMIPPATIVRAIAGTIETPFMPSSQAQKIAPNPTSAPIARSNTPADNATTRPTATSAVNAWLSSSVRQVVLVRNLSGIQSEKTTKTTMKT